MKATQLREQVIAPALAKIDLFSPEAVALVLGTACVESQCGEYIKQMGKGPALGIFQIEPATYSGCRLPPDLLPGAGSDSDGLGRNG